MDHNHLQHRRAERNLGSAPGVKVSAHHMAPEQGLEERQLRRWLRRLEEARFHANRGSALPKGLAKRIAKTPNIPDKERNAVKRQRCVYSNIKHQWQNHKKWLTFGGAVSQEPIVRTLGLLQGDPWSPICMSLILTVMGNMIKRMRPQSRCITYIDDRTILAPTKEILFQSLEFWTHLYEVTRLFPRAKASRYDHTLRFLEFA